MSDRAPVLYDLPGPAARRRSTVLSIIATIVVLAVLVVAAQRLSDNGQLSYEKWGALIDPSNEDTPLVWKRLGIGLWKTLLAAALAIALSLTVGTITAVVRMLLGRWSRIPLVAVMEVFRGLPVVVLIFMSYRMLPDIGIDLSGLPGPEGLWYVVVALTAYNSVVFAEIIRTGVASLPRGQGEAGTALGLTRVQNMRMILLPQAFRTMLPAIISQLVVVLKDTSLAGLLALYIELLREGVQVSNFLKNPLQTLFVVALIFIVINFALSRVAVLVERRMARGPRGTVAQAPTVEAGAPV